MVFLLTSHSKEVLSKIKVQIALGHWDWNLKLCSYRAILPVQGKKKKKRLATSKQAWTNFVTHLMLSMPTKFISTEYLELWKGQLINNHVSSDDFQPWMYLGEFKLAAQDSFTQSSSKCHGYALNVQATWKFMGLVQDF